MSSVLGSAIAIIAVALLAAACARYLWKDAKGCGGCAGCGGCSGGGCSRCGGCAVSPGDLPDVSALRVKKKRKGFSLFS